MYNNIYDELTKQKNISENLYNNLQCLENAYNIINSRLIYILVVQKMFGITFILYFLFRVFQLAYFL